MAKFTMTNSQKRTFWEICNWPEVQAKVKGVAIKGSATAKALAGQHVNTGQLLAGISVGTEINTYGMGVPVVDWLVQFEREDLYAIEYGGLSWSKRERRVAYRPGLKIVHRTLKAMGG